MFKHIGTAAAAALVGVSAFAFNIRPLTGTFINPSGGVAIAAGHLDVIAVGAVPAPVGTGILVPMPPYSFPIVAGALVCGGGCNIVAPANYKWSVYSTTAGVDTLLWTFGAGVPDVAGAITVQEIYSARATVTINPAYVLVGSDIADLSSGTAGVGTVPTADGAGGFTWTAPAGVGTITGVAAGTGLSGGGIAGAVTLDLDNTAVAAGAYGGVVGNCPAFTVDAQGRLIAAANRALAEADIAGLGADLALKAPINNPIFTGVATAPTFIGDLTGDVTGNADTVTAGVYTSGAYGNPAWIMSLDGGKLVGTVVATNGLVTTGAYADPAWLTSLSGAKIAGAVATATSATSFTGLLDGDVTGAQGATVVGAIGGSSAANVHAGELLANAATDANSGGRIVRRSAGGNFSAGTITATLTGSISGTAAGFTGALAGDVTGTQGATAVALVAGSSAANVHAGELLANAATDANTGSAIVRRSVGGNFSAGTITATLAGNAATVTNGVYTSRQIIAGVGLSGGGDLSADRTLTLGNHSTALLTSGNLDMARMPTGGTWSLSTGLTLNNQFDITNVTGENTPALKVTGTAGGVATLLLRGATPAAGVSSWNIVQDETPAFGGVNDPSLFFGYNVKAQGQRINTAEPTLHLGFETNYQVGGHRWLEHYLQIEPPIGGGASFRPFMVVTDLNAANLTTASFAADAYSFLNRDRTITKATIQASSGYSMVMNYPLLMDEASTVQYQAVGELTPRFVEGFSGAGDFNIQSIDAGIQRKFFLVSSGYATAFYVNFETGQTRVLGNLRVGSMVAPTEALDVTGNANVSGVYKIGAVSGMTTVVTVRNAGGGADCTMTFTGGILTATTCSHT